MHLLGSQIREAKLDLAPDLAQKIRNLTKTLGIIPADIFHLAWALVVGRCSGRDDVVFGTVLSGRLQGTEGADRTVGLFINTLPICLSLKGSVKACLELTHDELMALLKHEQASLNLAQACSGLSGDTPLFSALINYRHAQHKGDIDFSSDTLTVKALGGQERGNYPFDLSVDDYGEHGFELVAQMEASLDPARIVGYVACALAGIVNALEQTPERPLAELDILPEAERARLLHGLGAGAAQALPATTIHALFEAQAQRTPAALAAEHGAQRLSYAELNAQANRLAHYLLEQGLEAGERVGIYLPRSLEFLVAMLGILKAGGAYVVLEAGQPNERLAQIHARAALRTVVSCRALGAAFFADSVLLDDAEFQARLAGHAPTNPTRTLAPSAAAFAYFTSGSTGTPKGALNSHAGVVNNMLAMAQELALAPGDRVLQFAPLGFDVVIEEVLPAWFAGATVVLRDEEGLLDAGQLQALLTRQRITVCELMASYWAHWVAYLQQRGERPPASLRTLMLGSDRVATATYAQWHGYGIPIVNVFGLTEAACTSLVYRAEGSPREGAYLPNGRPLANTHVYVLDSHGAPVPEGVTGELYIGGVGVGLGYLGEPELTARQFLADPFSAGGRLYRTGDSARWLADGQLEFIGRRDRQVKLRGFRIELGEIEAQLQQLPAVQAAAVGLHPRPAGEARLIAWVTAAAAAPLELEALRAALRQRLPEYMVPTAIVELEALPLTLSGKVDYRALPAPAADHGQATYHAPQGATERTLAAIWASLLGVEAVGRQDHFFRLGGHSLLVIQLIAQLQTQGLNTDVRSVFDAPRLQDLAARIECERTARFRAPANRIEPGCTHITPDLLPLVELEQAHIDLIADQVPGGAANIQDIYPLAPLQEGILFHHMLADPHHGDTYVTPMLMAFNNRLELDRWIEAFNAVIARHDVLRTAVFWDNLPQPIQVVLREAQLQPKEIQLDASKDALAQLRARIEPGELWINLNQAPLIQIEFAADPQSAQYYLIINEHHIINDDIGLEVLIEELDAHLVTAKPDLPHTNALPRIRCTNPGGRKKQQFRGLFSGAPGPYRRAHLALWIA